MLSVPVVGVDDILQVGCCGNGIDRSKVEVSILNGRTLLVDSRASKTFAPLTLAPPASFLHTLSKLTNPATNVGQRLAEVFECPLVPSKSRIFSFA